MSDGGIPEPPGRDDLLAELNKPKPYRITYQDKKTGLKKTERIMAKNFREALQFADRAGFTFLSILEDR